MAEVFVVGRYRGALRVASYLPPAKAEDRGVMDLPAWDLIKVASSEDLARDGCSTPFDFYFPVRLDYASAKIERPAITWPLRAGSTSLELKWPGS